jgi:hypothetical protein
MRHFTKATPNMWASPALKGLQDDARLLWWYYLTSRHQTITGVSYVPDAYAADDLGWPTEKCTKARGHLCDTGAIRYDDGSQEVFITDWFRHNGPENSSQMAGCQRGVAAISSPNLRSAAEELLNHEWTRREEERKAAATGARASHAKVS